MALVEIDRKKVTVATVVAPQQPTGYISAFAYYNPASGDWEVSAPTDVPVGEQIGVMGYAVNSSAFALTLRMDALIELPSGGTTTYQGGGQEAAPGDQVAWAFDWYALPSLGEGTYEATLILYAVT